ncbi:hypothetical protein, partial [Corynebacterium matruchotii]|uniref:hypothetical protein n=1 Tax=Corynebacterium matruchotii TaxID=43768 RepID=UPI0028E970AE
MGHNSSSVAFLFTESLTLPVDNRIISTTVDAIIWGNFRKILMFLGIFIRRSHFYPHPPNFYT